jgi:hypothetical protein
VGRWWSWQTKKQLSTSNVQTLNAEEMEAKIRFMLMLVIDLRV